MYCSFYGIQEKPFSITPDPKYLYLGKTHQEAFAHLVYGIRERGGFIVVTGDIGTGKTTLCRALLTHLDADMRVAFIFNPTLSALELLKTINEDLGIRSEGTTQKELIDELNGFLLEQRKQGKNTVLIIDEAQNLDMEVLEHVRLLSNLETDTEKLLQIILIGQPEFREMLEQPRLLQLNQRVTVRYHLNPLSREEADAYVRHRLTVAGAEDKIRFTPEAMRKIRRYTKGVPRLINVLCDRALLAGYGRRTRDIDAGMVKQAHQEVRGQGSVGGLGRLLRRWRPRPGTLAGALAAVLLMLAGYGVHELLSRDPGTGPAPESRTASLQAGGPGPASGQEAAAAAGAPPAPPAPAAAPLPAEAATAPPPVSPASAAPAPVPPPETAPPAAVEAVQPDAALAPAEAPSAQEARAREMDRFRASLASRTIQETLHASLLAVAELWDLPAAEAAPPGQGPPEGYDIDLFARERGFRVYRFQGSYESLRALDLPVVLDLNLGSLLGRRYVALAEIRGDSAGIRPALPDGGSRVPQWVLEDLWTGKATILWKDWVGGRPVLMEGRSGEEVSWLQSALIERGYLAGEPTGFFDGNTRLAVQNFQEAAGLESDGILGPQTKIALFRALKRFPMPSLETGGRP